MTEYIDSILSKHNISMNNFISTMDELPLWSAPFGMMILDKVQYRKNLHVLDIGFGTGFPLLEIAQRLGKSSKLYGIDPWKDAIGRATKKCNVYDTHNVSLVSGYAEEMPFENNKFDLVISNNGLNNIQDISKVFKECYRVMKSGANLIFTVNLPGTMHEFYDLFEAVLTENGLFEAVNLMHTHIAEKRKTKIEWQQLISKNNLTIQSIDESEFKIKYADGTAMFQHHFIRLAFFEDWKEIIPIEESERVLSEVENRLNGLANDNNGLSLSIPFICFDCQK